MITVSPPALCFFLWLPLHQPMLPSTLFTPSLFHFPFHSSYWFLPSCEFMMAHGYVGEAGSLSLTNRPAFPLAHEHSAEKGISWCLRIATSDLAAGWGWRYRAENEEWQENRAREEKTRGSCEAQLLIDCCVVSEVSFLYSSLLKD